MLASLHPTGPWGETVTTTVTAWYLLARSDIECCMFKPRRTFAVCSAAVLGVLAGCAAAPDKTARPFAMNAAQPAIELLGFPGCPNTPAMRDNLHAALASIGKGWTFTDTNQEQLPASDLRRGWPTPTVLVNGRDLFGMPAPTAPSMGCRMYPGGVPSAADITDKLRTAPGK